MMKRWIAIMMACMLLLTGCGGKNPDDTKVPPTQETAAESEELAAFRKEIPDSSAQIAAAKKRLIFPPKATAPWPKPYAQR